LPLPYPYQPVPAPSGAEPPQFVVVPEKRPDEFHRGARSVAPTVLLVLALIFAGINLVANLVVGAVLIFAPDSEAAREFQESSQADEGTLWLNQTLIFVAFGVVPFLWVLGTRVKPWPGTVLYLGLFRPLKSVAIGTLLGIGMVIVVFILLFVLILVGAVPVDDAEEDQGPFSGDVLTYELALFLALTAGVGEEILFRGVLQRWIGLWGQAIIFSLMHAGGGHWIQLVVTLAVGVGFGYARRRGVSLILLIVAHFVYDWILFSGTVFCIDNPAACGESESWISLWR
jgi:uncharacterized protein